MVHSAPGFLCADCRHKGARRPTSGPGCPVGVGEINRGWSLGMPRTRPGLQCLKGNPDRLPGAGHAVWCRTGQKAVRSRRDKQRQSCLCGCIVVTAAHQINARRSCGRRLFGRFDMNVAELAFPLELAEIVDGVFFPCAEHGWRLGALRDYGQALRQPDPSSHAHPWHLTGAAVPGVDRRRRCGRSGGRRGR